jgi:hypothetical protein
MFKLKRARRSVSGMRITQLFHGVAIEPGKDCRCEAVAAIAGQRFLGEQAPLLPLEGCDCPDRCQCRYRHFADRRTDARREADVGLPMRLHPEEKRKGSGRRITDG